MKLNYIHNEYNILKNLLFIYLYRSGIDVIIGSFFTGG